MTDAAEQLPEESNDKISCQHCGEQVHVIATHLLRSDEHKAEREAAAAKIKEKNGMSDEEFASFKERAEYRTHLAKQLGEDYGVEFPDAPLMSEIAEEELARRRETASKREQPKEEEAAESVNEMIELKPLAKVFNQTRSKATKNVDGKEIMVQVFKEGHEFEYMVPKVDPDYVWDMELLKTIIMAVENKIPAYLWGYAGVGKSTGFTQYCAQTNRPMLRVQHTGDTESPHIIGQMLANEEGTYFNPGPLALAMKHGFFYLADEYDFAMPQVTSVYQPVLENNALYIKEADEEWRHIQPHENFYMCGTGNTNGAGDETGLFQGVSLQNAANFERYGIVKQVNYMEPKKEIRLLSKKTGLSREHIEPIVMFVNKVREAYVDGKITNTAGQRVSLTIAKLYTLQGNYMKASELALTNRLPESDRQIVSDLAQRMFGD